MGETGWWAGSEDVPDVVRRLMAAPDPAETYNWQRVEFIFDVLTTRPPRNFSAVRDLALDGHVHEWNAAQGMAVAYINDYLAAFPPGSAQCADAVARADELQRLTMGD